jgi:hypothetical protein
MEKSRSISVSELEKLWANIHKPDKVDQILFDSYKEVLVSKYTSIILGVEDDSAVKHHLATREKKERERLRRVNIRITPAMIEENNFPSLRQKELNKLWPVDEIPTILNNWSISIQNEVNTTFGQIDDKVSTSLRNKIIGMVEQKHLPNDVKDQNLIDLTLLITQRYVPMQWDILLTRLAVDYNDNGGNSPYGYDHVRILVNTLSEERYPTVEEVDDILSVIDYKKYMTGDGSYKDGQSRMLDITNDTAVKTTRDDLRRQIKSIKMQVFLINDFKESLRDQFKRSLILEGNLVGNVMSFAIGESSTQQTLNTFHSSGNRAQRAQITGFTQLKSILDASENPKQSTTTIFTRHKWTGTQMRLRSINFQDVSLADLIVSHRVIPSTPNRSKPRWEQIRDILYGEGHSVNYTGSSERFNLNRENPIFRSQVGPNGEPVGSILEIQLNIEKLFFMRISMKMIENALGQHSTNMIRVTTSDITIGMVYIYLNFSKLSSLEGVNDKEPSFVQKNPFAFALENVIYPLLQNIQISGIQDLKALNVLNHQLHKTINYSISNAETESIRKVATIHVLGEDIIYWGVTDEIIKEYIMVSMRIHTPNNHIFNYAPTDGESLDDRIGDEPWTIKFDTGGMVCWSEDENAYVQCTMADIQRILTSDKKIAVADLLLRTPESFTTIVDPVIQGSSMTFYINSGLLNSTVDMGDLRSLNLDLDTIGNLLGMTYSTSEIETEKYTIDRANSTVTVLNMKDLTKSINEILLDLRTVQITSNRLEESRIRWYYQGDGRNYKSVLAHKDVDSEYTRTSNIVDVYRTVGVEACRTITIKEIKLCTNSKINPAHIKLLADSANATTPAQKPIPQTHFGMAKRGTGFFALSWEKATKVFLTSGMGMEDNLVSFSAQLMTGKLNNISLLTKEDLKSVYNDSSIFGIDLPPVQSVNIESVINNAPIETQEVSTYEAPVINTPIKPSNQIIPSFSFSFMEVEESLEESLDFQMFKIESTVVVDADGDFLKVVEKGVIEDNTTLWTSNPMIDDNLFSILSFAKTSLDPWFDDPTKTNVYLKALDKIYPKIDYARVGEEKSGYELREIIQTLGLGESHLDVVNQTNKSFMCVNSRNDLWPHEMVRTNWKGISHHTFPVRDTKPYPKGVEVQQIGVINTSMCLAINKALDTRGIRNSIVLANGTTPKKSIVVDEGTIIHREDFQELDNVRLILSEFMYLLFSTRAHADLCIKMFDTFTNHSASIIYICTQLFEEVYMVKPTTSRPTNSEKYLVCKNRIPIVREESKLLLTLGLEALQSFDDPNNTVFSILNPLHMNNDPVFKKSYSNYMISIVNRQISALEKTINIANDM